MFQWGMLIQFFLWMAYNSNAENKPGWHHQALSHAPAIQAQLCLWEHIPPPNPEKNVKAFTASVGELIIFDLGSTESSTILDFKQIEWPDVDLCVSETVQYHWDWLCNICLNNKTHNICYHNSNVYGYSSHNSSYIKVGYLLQAL